MRFEIVTVVGESSRRRWGLSRVEMVLGYRPTVRLEDLGYPLGEELGPF
jgi:uronate dehydrogenase